MGYLLCVHVYIPKKIIEIKASAKSAIFITEFAILLIFIKWKKKKIFPMDEFKNIFSSTLFIVICKPRLLTLYTLETPATRVPRGFGHVQCMLLWPQ